MTCISMGGKCRRCGHYSVNVPRCPRCGARTQMGVRVLAWRMGRGRK